MRVLSVLNKSVVSSWALAVRAMLSLISRRRHMWHTFDVLRLRYPGPDMQRTCMQPYSSSARHGPVALRQTRKRISPYASRMERRPLGIWLRTMAWSSRVNCGCAVQEGGCGGGTGKDRAPGSVKGKKHDLRKLRRAQ